MDVYGTLWIFKNLMDVYGCLWIFVKMKKVFCELLAVIKKPGMHQAKLHLWWT